LTGGALVQCFPAQGWFWRLSRLWSVFGGTTEIMKEIIGRSLGL